MSIENFVSAQSKTPIPLPQPVPKPTLTTEQRNALVKKVIESKPRTIIKHPTRVAQEKPNHLTINKSEAKLPKTFLTKEESLKCFDGVHLDMYDFFNIPVTNLKQDTHNRLSYVMSWASKKTDNLQQALRRLNSLNRRLGCAATGEVKLDNIYNWLRLNGNA